MWHSEISELEIRPIAGAQIDKTVKEAFELTRIVRYRIVLNFNGISLPIDPEKGSVEFTVKGYWVTANTKSSTDDVTFRSIKV